MSEPVAVAWMVEWRIYPDRLSLPLKGRALKAAAHRSFHAEREAALREQQRLKLKHGGNPNFVSSVTRWDPPPPKPPKRPKPKG